MEIDVVGTFALLFVGQASLERLERLTLFNDTLRPCEPEPDASSMFYRFKAELKRNPEGFIGEEGTKAFLTFIRALIRRKDATPEEKKKLARRAWRRLQIARLRAA